LPYRVAHLWRNGSAQRRPATRTFDARCSHRAGHGTGRGSIEADSRKTPDPTTMTSGRIRELGVAFLMSRVLHAAVELDVFTLLAAGPLSANELTERLGLHPRASVEFFDTLVALGLLERDGAAYRNAREAGELLDRRAPTSIAAAVELNSLMYGQWAHLVRAL